MTSGNKGGNRGDSNELDQTELESLRVWQAQTQRELMCLRGMVGSALGASKAADNLRAQLARQSSEGGTNGVR